VRIKATAIESDMKISAIHRHKAIIADVTSVSLLPQDLNKNWVSGNLDVLSAQQEERATGSDSPHQDAVWILLEGSRCQLRISTSEASLGQYLLASA
jgi:hypothetical protein